MSILHHRGRSGRQNGGGCAKPIFSAELPDVVVSVPTMSGDPASAFVQFAVQFSSYDPNAGQRFPRCSQSSNPKSSAC